ncbi:LysM peptidoglycan-binding domain-containing protein [Ammoniphilus sp. 3BR4]|uniref:LysM peptidoglycan-binding domain-containing protein n=1 Tax=Ammoniphilus sp. 3BR4 TaxID=3158265 RepID=UPI003466B559
MERHGLGSYKIDIKEFVHLSHEQLPIEEIEEMEIVPQISIEENGDEIEITGALVLYGEYKGNQEAGKLDPADDLPESYEESVQFEPLSAERGPFSPLAKQDRFEYRIPVKISMPRNKVDDVEDVYAYINSFDYDLKTPYQVEVAASLMISGFTEKEEDKPEAEEVQWDAPFEFVHSAGDQSGQDFQGISNSNSFTERLEAIEQNFKAFEKEEVKPELPFLEAESETLKPTAASREEEVEQTERETAAQPEESPRVEVVQEEEVVEEIEKPAEQEELDNVVPLPGLKDTNQPEEMEEDVRVAITNKGTKKDQEPISSLSSVFSMKSRMEQKKMEEAEARSSEETKAATEEQADNDALYLTNFMGSQSEQFTKLRICILQKNETIEEIAERYQLTVDSILRANGAARNQVAAGQLLYIPVKR